MPRDIKMYLLDISNSIDSIFEYLGNERNFKLYDTNKLIRRAVERELEIVGEATNRIIKTLTSLKHTTRLIYNPIRG
jgi:uncharacterized protein with HEPN domain